MAEDLSTSFIHWFLKHIVGRTMKRSLFRDWGLNSAYVNVHSPVPTLNVLQNCSDKEEPHLKPSNQLLARTDTIAINSKKELIEQSSRVHKCKAAARLEPWSSLGATDAVKQLTEDRRCVSPSEEDLTWVSHGWTDPAGLLDRRAGTRSGPVCRRLSGTHSHYPADPNDTEGALLGYYALWV